MSKQLNFRTSVAIFTLYLFIPSYALADNMGGWGNPIFLVFLAIGVGIFYLIPFIGWLISINILKTKILNKYHYGTVKSISFWALFASGTVGMFMVTTQIDDRLYEVLGFSLPVLSAVLVILYAVIKKGESNS